jgi:hypothetical protein
LIIKPTAHTAINEFLSINYKQFQVFCWKFGWRIGITMAWTNILDGKGMWEKIEEINVQ